jgi:hypothetical protein
LFNILVLVIFGCVVIDVLLDCVIFAYFYDVVPICNASFIPTFTSLSDPGRNVRRPFVVRPLVVVVGVVHLYNNPLLNIHQLAPTARARILIN